MKNIMTRAWEIAKNAAVNFGGKVKMYFAEALKMAWAEVKGTVKESKSNLELCIEELERMVKTYGGSYWTSDWAKGNHNRTYFKYKGDRKSNKVQDFGYINNVTGEYVQNGSRWLI